VEILNIIDDHPRLAVGSTVQRTTLAGDVAASFEKAFARCGIPAGVLTDIQSGCAASGVSRRPAGRIGAVRHPSVIVA